MFSISSYTFSSGSATSTTTLSVPYNVSLGVSFLDDTPRWVGNGANGGSDERLAAGGETPFGGDQVPGRWA